MDLDYKILNLYKTRQYDECLKQCEMALNNKSDRMIEFIRMRVMTVQAKIAGNGYEEVDYYPQYDELANTAVAKTPRPGTSFQSGTKTALNIGPKIACEFVQKLNVYHAVKLSKAGDDNKEKKNLTFFIKKERKILGLLNRGAALFTASRASRAATALADGTTFTLDAPVTLRFLNKDDKFFISAAKTLFEYIYYCEGNIRKAMEVIFQAQKTEESSDWWWNFSLARCYYSLGMYRNVEECLRPALKQSKHISIYLRLIAMYVGIDQPLSALDVCKQGLSVFHESTPLLLEEARIHERMGNQAVAVKYYRMVAIEDPSNMEAIANIAMYNFYNDQPEIALRYYRRLLATNPVGPEIYNNLGLCCMYCNQWDLILPCFRQALYYSTNPEVRSDIWYNLAHVALTTGDILLARRCLLCCVAISEHGPARRALRAVDMRAQARTLVK